MNAAAARLGGAPTGVLDEALRVELGALDVGPVALDEPLERWTAFRTGGPADAWIRIPDTERWGRLLAWCRERKVPVTHVGRGCGLVVRRGGIRGVVIGTGGVRRVTRVDGDSVAEGVLRVRADAGARVASVLQAAADAGAVGLEVTSEPAGTIGGLLRRSWARVMPRVVAVGLLGDRGKVRVRGRGEIGDKLPLPGRTAVAWATFEFERDDGETLFDARRFTSAESGDPEREERGKMRLFRDPLDQSASALLDGLGVRGIRLRRVAIDEADPNRAWNLGGGSAGDLRQLVRYVRERAARGAGVELEEAFRVIGKK